MTPDYTNVSPLGVMNFLSEVAYDYPRAISFASGRPTEAFFDFDGWLEAIARFRKHDAATHGNDIVTSGRRLAQYGRTNGLINALVAAQLAADDGVICTPDQVVITNGCQEALALCLQALCPSPNDVVIARNPTYIGVTGATSIAGIALAALDVRGDETLVSALSRTIAQLAAQGQRARAIYLIPEFDNPTGEMISMQDREAILQLCMESKVVILEDNPYGMFRFEGTVRPAMATLDRNGSVIYLGTYSKTLCPAVRVGCAVIPKTLFGDAAASRALVESLGVRKSFLTVNTSQFNQALVGGVLLAEGGSLHRLVQPALEFYRRNRDALIEHLTRALGGPGARARWNNPQGGFFLSVDLPFAFDASEMVKCADQYDVLVMPMSFFALDNSQQNRARLSFSNLTVEEIAIGVERFTAYISDRLAVKEPCGSFSGPTA